MEHYAILRHRKLQCREYGENPTPFKIIYHPEAAADIDFSPALFPAGNKNTSRRAGWIPLGQGHPEFEMLACGAEVPPHPPKA